MEHTFSNLRELKGMLETLSDKELDKPLIYDFFGTNTGVITKIEVQQQDLYWNGEDDPSVLCTKQQILDDGDDPEEYDIEIPKGSFVVRIK